MTEREREQAEAVVTGLGGWQPGQFAWFQHRHLAERSKLVRIIGENTALILPGTTYRMCYRVGSRALEYSIAHEDELSIPTEEQLKGAWK